MELDHIFIFTREQDKLADAIKNFGLSEGTPNAHPGQGTACRRFYFQNAYLELVWIVNEDESKSTAIAKARLWERSQYRLTNHCPFGICFRTPDQSNKPGTLIFKDGWRYYSDFLPVGHFANIASNEDFSAEPMLFEMPFFGLAPKDYPLSRRQPLIHERGIKEITGLSFTLPLNVANLSSSMRQVIQSNIISVKEGTNYFVSIELDYGKNSEVLDLNPLAPLALAW